MAVASVLMVLATLPAAARAAHWAVIMAGSQGYSNYRHQADACHAYQIAKGHGIPESNIILLAYDDIANSSENPFPGKLFNQPNGSDVYAGCQISYRGQDVTAENFLKVLRGDANASGPVLNSTAEDNVFVYYSDHGATGIIAAPVGPPIHATDLNEALEELHRKGMYKELLFYLEACESGSMFADLLKAPKVKAVTASNPTESSYGFYCPPDDVVQGKQLNSCLGDEFSIRWMEDADVAKFNKETVAEQVLAVTKQTKKSHVTEYGDSSIDGEPIGHFEGASGSAQEATAPAPAAADAVGRHTPGSTAHSRDVELHLAFWAVRRAQGFQQKRAAEDKLHKLLVARQAEDARFERVALAATKGDAALAREVLEAPVERLTRPECHKAALAAALRHCGGFSDYALRHSRLLANLCERGLAEDEVAAALRAGCAQEAASLAKAPCGAAEVMI